MTESAAWWRARARCVIERVVRECALAPPVRLRRELRDAYRRHRRANAPRYTRVIWYEQARRALGSRIRDVLDRRQLALFTSA